MNRTILLIALATTVLFACRKETPTELPFGIAEMDPGCANGIMDGQEDGVDCGTLTCKPCLLSSDIFCNNETFTDNRFFISAGSGVTTDFTADQVTSSTASGKFVITASTGTRTVRFTFASASPEIFKAYECKNNLNNLQDDEVYVQYISGNSTYVAYSSEVNLNREGGKYTVTFCSMNMIPNNATYAVAKGRLISSN